MVGTPHEGSTPHSGRFPYGSGENPRQRPSTFVERVQKMKADGLSDTDISKGLKMPTRQWKAKYSVEMNEFKLSQQEETYRLFDAGFNKSEISRKLGVSEATIRNWLKGGTPRSKTVAEQTADVLKKELTKSKYLDVGHGTAETMGISETRLTNALRYLQDKEGYEVHKIKIQSTQDPNRKINMTVLCPPGVSFQEVKKNAEDIGIVNARYNDSEFVDLGKLRKPVKSISSDRIEVAYREDGGANKDGVIELRRGVEGLDLGQARYAQVRIGVDDTHYLKGMAIYSDDLPDGIDIRFNTSKSKDDPKMVTKLDAFKPMETTEDGSVDKKNPFNALIKPDGQRGYLNVVREEGDWSTWSKTLASQMLSKQPVQLAKKQLAMTTEIAKQEFDELSRLTNPVVKQHLLLQFADECDRAAVHLKAAAMPRQGNYVILPVNSLKPNQIYAPNYNDGETVVLIRYPHGGKFEIPELTVNNRNREAKRLFGGAQDAVGIHPSQASVLSGADFDGDTVLVIPNDSRRIKKDTIKGLEDFDPKVSYPEREGMKYMKKSDVQNQMGRISNLITDMSLQDAPPEHIVRAVKHSMVVIDAYKHKLDYTQSYKDNDIDELKRLYQKKSEVDGKKRYGGASTLISRAKAQVWVPDRTQLYGKKGIDPVTGEKVYKETGEMSWDSKTQSYTKPKQLKSSQMAEAKDARELLSTKATAMEITYANYANGMKAMANNARKMYLATPDPTTNSEAKVKYHNEVIELKAALSQAVRHQPYERKANILANAIVAQQVSDNPAVSYEEKKKLKTKAIIEMRSRLGGKKPTITITPKQWEAIQAGAVAKSTLKEVLRYADQDQVKQLALPKEAKGLTPAKLSLARSMRANGHSLAEIAARCGVSQSTIQAALKG